MLPNGIRTAWAAGKPVINGWLSIGSPFTAEIMAAQGYDALTVDMQHGALGYEALLPMQQAVRGSPVTPMARVPWLSAGDLMKALDAGASILVVHDLADLRRAPDTGGAGTVVCGHSHRPRVEERDGVLTVNPGSAGPRRFSLPISAGELRIAGGRVTAHLKQF